MNIYEIDNGWAALAPAKLNLFFEVHGRREDGFHEITSLALPIRLYDELRFEPTDDDRIELQCFGGASDIPHGEENIVVRALSLLKRRAGTHQGANVRLFKRIPSQAGLGGGSSDAVAALRLARKAWNLDLSHDELRDLSAEIGSDCPIFFHSGISLSRGRGERIEATGWRPDFHFVILKPREGLSTARVYAECMKFHDGRFHDPEELLFELRRGDTARSGRCFFNRLEAAAESIWPRFAETERLLRRLDCLAVRMSGSGTAFYGLCRNARHARWVAGQLRRRTRRHEDVFWVAST